jgi:hypothetical protein
MTNQIKPSGTSGPSKYGNVWALRKNAEAQVAESQNVEKILKMSNSYIVGR